MNLKGLKGQKELNDCLKKLPVTSLTAEVEMESCRNGVEILKVDKQVKTIYLLKKKNSYQAGKDNSKNKHSLASTNISIYYYSEVSSKFVQCQNMFFIGCFQTCL